MRNSFVCRALAALALLAAPATLFGQSCPDAKKLTAGMTGPIATVRYLADDALGGRLAGSPGERCAGEFIAARFKQLGLKAAGDSGTYFQSFSLASAMSPHGPTGTGRNVIAWLEGSDPQLKNEVVVIGAHYDHLGMGPFGSTRDPSDTVPAIHNGADDNASGVAAMLEVAARLKKARAARSVVFLAFSGEEEGLLGSNYFAAHPTVPFTKARAMLNMDMVGRLGAGPLIVYGIGTATEWQQVVTQAAQAQKLAVTLQPDGYGASDHTSFYLKDIPVLHFFSNTHGDYHKPSDDWEKIDVAGLNKVSQLVTDIAQNIAGKQTTLTLVKMPAPVRASGRGSSASLGTIPDFTPVPKGVKISGVRPGSAAELAGMKAGDIIIGFDDTEIADLQGFSNALNARKPGDAVRVKIIRDGQEMVLPATLGRR